MGNCCKVVKKENDKVKGADKEKEKEKENIKPSIDSGTMITDDRSQRTKSLQITCESPKISLSIRYRPTIPIQDIKEQILAEHPNIDIEKFSLFRDNLEILDATATLQQLGILPGDTLTLQLSMDSDDVIASENNSIPEMKDEMITNEITTKRGLAARSSQENNLTSPRKHAQEL